MVWGGSPFWPTCCLGTAVTVYLPFSQVADGDAGLDPGAGWAGVGGAEDGEQILVASLLVLDVE